MSNEKKVVNYSPAMNRVMFTDLAINKGLDIPEGFTKEEEKQLKEKFIHHYTLGIDPYTLFHLNTDFLKKIHEDRINSKEHMRQVRRRRRLQGAEIVDNEFRIRPEDIIQDQTCTIETWQKYLADMPKEERIGALERLKDWLTRYYEFRITDSIWNTPIPVTAESVLIRLRGWINRRAIYELDETYKGKEKEKYF